MNVVFENGSYFDVGFTQGEEFVVDLGHVKQAEEYTGEYIITPKALDETILQTNGKIMGDDVTVLKVPYYETSNESGETVYIAAEV